MTGRTLAVPQELGQIDPRIASAWSAARVTRGPMSPVWLVMVGGAPAAAQTPVVHAEPRSGPVMAAVGARTGLPASQLRAVALEELLSKPPEVVGEGVLRRCAAASSLQHEAQVEAVRTDLARAKAGWQRKDALDTMDHLDVAVSRLGCLQEVADGRLAAQVFLLRAAVHVQADDLEAARSELATAQSLHPGVAWPRDLPEHGAVLLAEARRVEPVTVRVEPAKLASGPWLDGRAVQGATSVLPGLHLLQYTGEEGVASAWLSVGGALTVVLPRGFGLPALAAMGSTAGHEAMTSLLLATLPDAVAAYVWHEHGLWLVSPGGPGEQAEITELAPRKKPEPPPLSPKEERRRRREARRRARQAD